MEFRCLSSDDTEHIKYAVSATYDESSHKWEKDVAWLTPEEQRVTRIFPAHGANSNGVAMTRDDTGGPLERRTRAFAFCLRRPPLVLCGSTSAIASLTFRNNKAGLLPYALMIMNSIDFVDTPLRSARAGNSPSASDEDSTPTTPEKSTTTKGN